ncbi:phosphoglycerate mutase family protein [Microlunatus soli]|nr:phosphoglycerate mutase family protein [Microlunatus soli]
MSFLEVRRHSWRQGNGGSQLSQRGVDRARQLGEGAGPYARVVTSVLPRARETAIAMGFAVDQVLVTQLADEALYDQENIAGATDSRWERADRPLQELADRIAEQRADQGPRFRLASTLAGLWRDLMTPYGDGPERVLFIGHSGDLEYGLVGALPEADHSDWGGNFGPLEGALLEFTGEPARFSSAQLLRVDGAATG